MKCLLLKGFEVELFTGYLTCEHYGISDHVTKVFSDFVKEPDKRNLEYITEPDIEYSTEVLEEQFVRSLKPVGEA